MLDMVDSGKIKRKNGGRGKPKGRIVEPSAAAEVRALLGDEPRRRDLLIEHLHKIQDKFGHISAAHLVALAREMKLAMTEVYEVASFYHHFDIIKEGDTPPPALTVRVCDSLSCELGGASALITGLKSALGDGARVIPAPCVGRCEQAPVAVVGQNPVAHATVEKVRALAVTATTQCAVGKYLNYNNYLSKSVTVLPPNVWPVNATPKKLSRPWSIPACAVWAARDFRRGASGALCAVKTVHA